ncbi:GDSL-type esterase/lipase family protein [Dysosmobacter sp.]|uniref:GDSL-type esterase/lipase family protein n=1 Tax=Dysosmobacter sp. TaxID=2591382 RepID=UPI002A8BB1E0|nr:GDSL-type esterase/lipase family protein [Dysosmobacter sp.]MDY3984345.1 GDSL-type esterase/lipase family protein [Dysosmobacter sp.]
MKKHIVCLGDSNTHGYCPDPSDCADGALSRFNEEERWTCLLQKQLGDAYLVVEEGLSGRTTVFDDPVEEGMAALPCLYAILKSHKPVDLLIVMLGTNDTKERLGANAYVIGKGMERLLEKARSIDCWGPEGKPNILLIAPPAIGEGLKDSDVAEEMGAGAVEKSRQVPARFQAAAEETGARFLDAGALGCTFNQVDFMHLTRASHARLAEALAKLVPELL